MDRASCEFLLRAKALLPALTEREAAVAQAREVAAATIEDFHRTGILGLLQPRAFGGSQGSFRSFSGLRATATLRWQCHCMRQRTSCAIASCRSIVFTRSKNCSMPAGNTPKSSLPARSLSNM